MIDLPTGTVTFLFSDIEGSTRLVQELGPDRFTALLEQHNRLMRAAFAANEGIDRGTQGDSFMAVFRDPASAVSAAVAAQRAIAAAAWTDGRAVLVRMGVHTGEVAHGGDDYVGLDVNRAARIAAAAHGGQVLVSEATRGLIGRRLPDGVRFEFLGSFRLKDLPSAETIHQLEVRGLRSGFPPIRALNLRRAHLPPETTSFVGRDAELEAVVRLLAERRLVSLTGPGGSGKTRLAIRAATAAAERHADGAYFVAAATLREASELAPLVASSLNLAQGPGQTAADVVTEWLRDRDVLLVLDNLEQMTDAGSAVESLMADGPSLRVLTTTRSALRSYGEQEFRVPPLPVPSSEGDPSTIEDAPAVRLFVERARLIDAAFDPAPQMEAIAAVTRRLQGLPLAIELAAARSRVLPIAEIRDRLDRQLDVLVSGPATAPQRQRSLRDTIAWSHDLLDEEGRALFRRLGVFVGGWTALAAEAVGGTPPVGDVLAAMESLAAQSLIEPLAGGGRFTMLVALREFALAELARAGETDATERRHADWFRRLADEALAAAAGPGRAGAFDRLDADLDNIKLAIERASAAGDHDQALGTAAALRWFLLERNHTGDGQRILLELIDRATDRSSREFAAAAAAASAIADWLGDYGTARRTGAASVEAFRSLGDPWALADALGSFAFATIEVDPAAALELNRGSFELYREIGDVGGQGQALLGRATAQFATGDLDATKRSLDESIALLERAGDEYFAIFASVFLGRIELLLGNGARGMALYRHVLERSRALDLRIGVAVGLEYLAEVAIWSGDVARAVRLAARADRLKQDLGGGVPPRTGGAPDALVVGRAELPEEAFKGAYETGATLDLDSAIAEGLASEPPAAIPGPPA